MWKRSEALPEELDLLRSLQQTSALIQSTGQYFWLLDLLHYAFSSCKLAVLWAWYPSVICSCQPASASSFAPSILSSADSVPRAQRLQERDDVSLSCKPKMVWLAGALLQEELHWELYFSSQCPYASSVPSAGCRSCEIGDEEENLSCLFLFPIILLCPCYLLLLPNSLFSASFSSVCLVNSISLLPLCLVISHFSFVCPHTHNSRFWVSLVGLFCLFSLSPCTAFLTPFN